MHSKNAVQFVWW